jgi:aerobic carbon-monoxide dehydrogenase small subunit
MSLKREISFVLNGVRTTAHVPLEMSALTMLREVVGLTGTKYACGEGECGACTVIVDGASQCSCLLFAVDCDGRTITTIEGVSRDPLGQKIEQAFVQHGAVQCGFCTPGMVVQATTLLREHPEASREQIQRAIEGNLCRCTGYVKIVDAIESVAKERPEADALRRPPPEGVSQLGSGPSSTQPAEGATT